MSAFDAHCWVYFFLQGTIREHIRPQATVSLEESNVKENRAGNQ